MTMPFQFLMKKTDTTTWPVNEFLDRLKIEYIFKSLL